MLNTNYSMGVKKYEDNDTDDQITKGIMLVDGKVVDKNSLVVVKKIEAVYLTRQLVYKHWLPESEVDHERVFRR